MPAEDLEEVLAEDDEANGAVTTKNTGKKARTVYGEGSVYPRYFSNIPTEKRTIRIDVKMLAKAESGDPNVNKRDAAEELRRVVSTVGKVGQPGEHVRCVVSVSMLTEGWDANNVTHILGVRAFRSQLLCEQVVGRGLRRMDYTPDPQTGLRQRTDIRWSAATGQASSSGREHVGPGTGGGAGDDLLIDMPGYGMQFGADPMGI